MKREQFISYFFIGILAFIVYQVFLIFVPFFNSIFWAAILTFAFYPIYLKLLHYFPKRDMAIALFMTLIVFLIVIPPLLMILVNLTTQVIEFSQRVYSYIRDGKLEQLIESIRELPWIQRLQTHVISNQPMQDSLSTWILETLS